MLSKEELLKPRYVVIALWPGSFVMVGYIFEFDDKGIWSEQGFCKTYDPYPHLFRLLQWWEKRELSDMPEYVKFIKPYHKAKANWVCKVANWSQDLSAGNLFDLGWFNLSAGEIQPATLDEYTSLKK